jgi:glucosamine--fructose-6-phosphate aminotransferase (isomerizing)
LIAGTTLARGKSMAATVERGYHTYKEIVRQQDTWEKALEHLATQGAAHRQLVERYRARVWAFTGCGTSYYLAQTAAALFEMITGVRALAVPASEIVTYAGLVFNAQDSHVLVAFSRSGTTTETLWAAQKARNELSIPVVTVSCDDQSPLAREGHHLVTFPFQAEQSTVMTGSFTTMLLSLVYLAAEGASDSELQVRFARVPGVSKQIMQQHEPTVRRIATLGLADFVFLAQGPLVGVANEAALKVKEMSLSPAVGYHALEFRHGPMSVVTERSLIAILFSQAAKDLELRLGQDLKKLGAKLLFLQEQACHDGSSLADFQLLTPNGFGDVLNSFLFMPLLQLLGYYQALEKGLDPDHPKNLTAVIKL